MRVKTRYRKYRDGGAVPADDVVTPDVRAPHETETDPLANIELPETAKTWLRKNPRYLYDADENAKIGAVHHKLVGEGYEPYSAPYFAEIEARLEHPAGSVDEAMASPIPAEAEEYETPNSRIRLSPKRATVSAPPSHGDTIAASYMAGRNCDASQGRITLTTAEKEAAKISGISEAEYAFQLVRLREEQANDPARYGSGR